METNPEDASKGHRTFPIDAEFDIICANVGRGCRVDGVGQRDALGDGLENL